MTPHTLIDELAARGVVVSVVRNSLELEATEGELATADVELVRAFKQDVLRWLKLADGHPIDDDAERLLAMEEMDPADVLACPVCRALCDIQRIDDAWVCSRCAPEAQEIRQRTRRFLC